MTPHMIRSRWAAPRRRRRDLVAAASGSGTTWAVAYSSTGGSGVYLRTVSPK